MKRSPGTRANRSVGSWPTAALLGLALFALLAGGAVYPLFRLDGHPLPVALTASLPALLHSFGFGLLLLLVLQPWPRWWTPAMVAWSATLCLAELVQLGALAGTPLEAASTAVDATAGTAGSATAPHTSYLLGLFIAHGAGTFDPLDIVASITGAGAALGMMTLPASMPVRRARAVSTPAGTSYMGAVSAAVRDARTPENANAGSAAGARNHR